MNEVFTLKTVFSTAAAAVGGAIGMLFGTCTVVMQALLIFMAADYITGLLVAAVFKRSEKTGSGGLSSRAGFKGLCRKGGILTLVLVAAQLDRVMNTTYLQPAVALFFLWNEGLSILENIGLMGVPYPDVLKKALDALHEEKK